MSTNEIEMSEHQAVNLIRNALLIAGQEMGTDGDHWQAIKSTVHSLMKDYEHLKIERNVEAELKVQLYAQLEIMEHGIHECSEDLRPDLILKLKELREHLDSYFTPLDVKASAISDDEIPDYLKRVKIIVDTLEETHG